MKKFVVVFVLILALPLIAGEGHSCADKAEKPTTAAAGEHGKSCGTAEGKAVEMDGTLLCKKCDLKTADKCEKVFQPASDTTQLIAICKGSKADLEKLSQHGGSKIHIKGKLAKCAEDGKEELVIEEASKI